MKKSDILWAVCEADEDLVLRAKENLAVTKSHVRPLRVALIAAAIAVLLSGTVLGAYAVKNWDQVLAGVFHIGETEQGMLDGSLTDVYATVERSGCTYTVKQVMGDVHCIVVSLDIQLPEDLVLNTVSLEELKAVPVKEPYSWEDVLYWMRRRYGYEEGDESVTGGVYLEQPLLFPVDMDEETLLSEAEAYMESRPGSTVDEAMGWVLYHKALEDFNGDRQSGEGTSFGSGVFYRSYDPDTNVLSNLIYMETDNDIHGKTCTLVLSGLVQEDILEVCTHAFSDTDTEPESQNLLSEPLVLRFTADYEPQSRVYDIQQDGVSIGTLELSPFSAFVTFPQEQDDTEYSSLEQAALAPHRVDYLGEGRPTIEVTATDGTTAEFQIQSSSISYAQTGFFITDRVVDLDGIEAIQLNGYTFVPVP